MSSIIRLRPLAIQCRRYPPKLTHVQWYEMPPWSSSSLWPAKNTCNRSLNIVENNKIWKLSYDLPGIKAKDLSVTANGSNVQISASRHFTTADGDGKTTKKSRIFQSFLVNSNIVDLSQLKANLSDGVLVITAPKKSESGANQITITTAPHEEDDSIVDQDVEKQTLEEEFENVTINDSTTKADPDENNKAT